MSLTEKDVEKIGTLIDEKIGECLDRHINPLSNYVEKLTGRIIQLHLEVVRLRTATEVAKVHVEELKDELLKIDHLK